MATSELTLFVTGIQILILEVFLMLANYEKMWRCICLSNIFHMLDSWLDISGVQDLSSEITTEKSAFYFDMWDMHDRLILFLILS